MIEWKCGKCGKIYTTEEFLMLKKVKAVESDIDPSKEHGFVGVCDCGYRFHLDKWILHDIVKIKIDEEDIDITISTVYLELNGGFYEEEKNLWYETMIFPGGFGEELIECSYVNRYETKEDALLDHNRIVNLLKEGKYKIEDLDENKKELVILEE